MLQKKEPLNANDHKYIKLMEYATMISAYAMMTNELVEYAKKHNLPIPNPLDRTTKSILIKTVHEHMSKKGGRKRTIKKGRTLKKK